MTIRTYDSDLGYEPYYKTQSLSQNMGIRPKMMINSKLDFKSVFLDYVQNRHKCLHLYLVGFVGITLTQPKSTHSDAIMKT